MAQPHYPEPLDGHVRRIVAWLDTNRREAFEERAAIAQYDGNLDQEQAERMACLDILATYGLPCPVQLLQVEMAGSTDWVLTTDVQATTATLAGLVGAHGEREAAAVRLGYRLAGFDPCTEGDVSQISQGADFGILIV